MSFENQIKAFCMTNMLIESDIDKIENLLSIKLRDIQEKENFENSIERAYFPQFTESLRKEAASMAKSYELFYCLEKTIRRQIADLLESNVDADWWNDKVVPQHIVGEVKKRMQREKESAITPRSLEPLDYTNFGELGEIIKANWSIFASVIQ